MTVPGPPTQVDAPTRPDSVKLAVELWCAVVVATIVTIAAQYEVVRDRAAESIRQMGEQAAGMSVTTLSVAAIALAVVVISLVSGLVLKFLWDGRNWARQVLGVFAAFVAVQLLFVAISFFVDVEPADGPTEPAWAMIFHIAAGVAAIGTLAALMHRDTAAFCRDRAAWRTRNRQNGVR